MEILDRLDGDRIGTSRARRRPEIFSVCTSLSPDLILLSYGRMFPRRIRGEVQSSL